MSSRLGSTRCVGSAQASRRGAPRIAILGAGISGLVAAYELKKLGLAVTIFERSERVGGRIRTHTFAGTTHAGELGAMRIPASHEHTLRYIAMMGLEGQLSRFTTLFQNRSCVVDLSALADVQGLFLPPRGGGEGLVEHATKVVVCKLKVVIDAISPGEIRDVFHWYCSHGLYSDLETLLRTSMDPKQLWFILNATIEELIEFASGFAERMPAPLRHFLRDIALEISRELFYLKGGMQQLPQRLAESMPEVVSLCSEIRSIVSHDTFVELEIHDRVEGISRRERYDLVVCTIPVPALRRMALQGFSEEKMSALRQARYASASKVLLLCRRAFWQHPPYAVRSGAAFVGGLARQVYYPDVLQEEDISESGRGALIASYTIGRDADRVAELTDDELISLVKQELGRIHPELLEPGMVEDHKVQHWQKEEGFLGGCSVSWPLYYEAARTDEDIRAMWEASARPERRIYFAGEHCSNERAWIEGAVKSSLRTVDAVRRRLGHARAQYALA